MLMGEAGHLCIYVDNVFIMIDFNSFEDADTFFNQVGVEEKHDREKHDGHLSFEIWHPFLAYKIDYSPDRCEHYKD
jgi:hypothetical protein